MGQHQQKGYLCEGIYATILVLGTSFANHLAGFAVAEASSTRVNPTAQVMSQAIARGLDFLVHRQQSDGSFVLYTCYDPDMTRCETDTPIYGAALIVYSLHLLEGPAAEKIRQRTRGFLQREQDADGLWRYHPHVSPLHSRLPPDMDDTAVSAQALAIADGGQPDHASRLLQYRTPAGLFPTWIATTDPTTDPAISEQYTSERQRVDCGVNANVLAYLAFEDVSAPEVCLFVTQMVAEGPHATCLSWAPSAEGIAYVASRAYASGASCLAPAMSTVREQLLNSQTAAGDWGNELNTALAVNALLNTDYRGAALDSAVQWLLNHQRSDGSWRRFSYYRDWMFYGSEELTTAFVLEALAKAARSNAGQFTPRPGTSVTGQLRFRGGELR